jgi:phospholipid/cholesterol/gamma-HCH transport system ATP-binding protein
MSAEGGTEGAILELVGARPMFDESGLTARRYDLRVMPGDCVLIEAREPERASLFADLCSGIVPLADGTARCMGLDWANLGEREAWALRGRIGRISSRAPWIDFYGTHLNIMMPQLHHTRRPSTEIEGNALDLCRRFGLPGLPTLPPGRLSDTDLARSACVRAFMGAPSLLLLEDPVTGEPPDLYSTFLREITASRERGTSVVWFSAAPERFRDYRPFASQRFRLMEEGLFSMHDRRGTS